ncbi:MAG: hypothetical protein M3Q97_08720 [Bacteroidota bacterium]|nr:hypothetical protein [Bacteroidota bacterium]
MKVNEIKQLTEKYDLPTLQELQGEIENDKPLSHEVPGNDEGEKLTHILAAIWIHEQVTANQSDIKTELRNFAARVRTSIS